MKRLVYLFSALFLLAGCHKKSQEFEISGAITGAKNQVLRLEYLGLKQTTALDSAVLNNDGKFCFRHPAPQNPDFYRLRLNGKSLILAVDSIEKISLHTDAEHFAFSQVEGSSETNKITLLRLCLRDSALSVYKNNARNHILRNPLSLSAYYALYQQKNGEYVFDPLLKEDLQCFRAVATAWKMRYPDYERTRSLYNITSEIIRQDRINRSNDAIRQFIDESENAFLDIKNTDENGDYCSLSSLRGNWIVLDFSCLNEQWSPAYILQLRELYNDYNKKGLKIYSVSLDNSRLLWEQSARNLPWTTVWQERTESDNAIITYNVDKVPTLFLFDKQGNILSRYTELKALRTDLEKYIK